MTDQLPGIPAGPATDSSDVPYEAPPMRSMPGRRAGMTVYAGTGEVEYHGSTPPAAPAVSTSGPIRPTFQSPSGQPVMAKDLGPDSLVVNPITGDVESDLGSLMAAGLIRETANGWELAGPDGQFASPAAVTGGDKAPDNETTDPEPQVERNYLPLEDEAALRAAEGQLGDTFQALESVMQDLDLDSIPDNLVATVGAKMGLDREQALAAIHEHAAPYIRQAGEVIEADVGPGTAQEVLEFGKTNPRGREVLREAMRRQVDNRDTSGYTALTHEWLRDLAMRDPARVAAGIVSGGGKAKVVNGQVLVDLGDGQGWTEFTSAIRGGAAKVGRR